MTLGRLNLVNRDDLREGVNLSVRAVRDLAERGVCLSCGVGRVGLEVKFTLVGSDLVTRRERREGVFSGAAEAEVVAPLDGGVSPPSDGLPLPKVELIDAPMVNLLSFFFGLMILYLYICKLRAPDY